MNATDYTLANLREWDWILVNTSAGKDSQVQLGLICEAAREQGVLDRVVAVHCDLGEMEWAGTRDLAEEQAFHYGIRFEVVKRTQNDILGHVRHRGRWPGPTTRFCTSDHKRGPVRTLMTRLVREIKEPADGPRNAKRVRILNCLGLRAEEGGPSGKRAKMSPLAPDKPASNGRRDVWTFLPIHQWKLNQVWDYIQASDVPHHFAYDLGMPRLSCVFCIFASKEGLALAGKHNRALLDRYVAVEEELHQRGSDQPNFTADLSIKEIRDLVDAGVDLGPVTEWNDRGCA